LFGDDTVLVRYPLQERMKFPIDPAAFRMLEINGVDRAYDASRDSVRQKQRERDGGRQNKKRRPDHQVQSRQQRFLRRCRADNRPVGGFYGVVDHMLRQGVRPPAALADAFFERLPDLFTVRVVFHRRRVGKIVEQDRPVPVDPGDAQLGVSRQAAEIRQAALSTNWRILGFLPDLFPFSLT
jgi:hypothetical protein